jgi:hypothetical protein
VVVAAVVVAAAVVAVAVGNGGDGDGDNARSQIGRRGGGSATGFIKGTWARGPYVVRIMCHPSDKLGLGTFVRDMLDPRARPEYWIELITTFT